MKVVALLLLCAGSAFAANKPELTIGKSIGEYRSQVYTPALTPTGYKSSKRTVDLDGIYTSLGVRTDLSDELTLRTAVGFSDNYSEDLFDNDRFVQASLQNTIFSATEADRFYLSLGISGHRTETLEGDIASVGFLAGAGYEHVSYGFGWNLAIEQNETLQANDLDVSGVLIKNNHFSYLNYSAGINYSL